MSPTVTERNRQNLQSAGGQGSVSSNFPLTLLAYPQAWIDNIHRVVTLRAWALRRVVVDLSSLLETGFVKFTPHLKILAKPNGVPLI